MILKLKGVVFSAGISFDKVLWEMILFCRAILEIKNLGLPCWSSGSESTLQWRDMVQSLVRELRSHRAQLRPNAAKKKKRNKKFSGNLGCNSDFWRHWATISQHTACRKTPPTFCYHNLLNTLMMLTWASQVIWVVKNLLANVGHVRDEGSVPRWGHGNSVQNFRLKNSTERSLVGYSP